MPTLAQVCFHPSQFPDQVRRDLLESLRSRRLNHKFLYDGLRQIRLWLALHRAFAPSRTEPDCLRVYEESFRAAGSRLRAGQVHLFGLGCGGGQKDTRCLELLEAAGEGVSYTPVDVSAVMVLTARQTALKSLPALACAPLVCDLATAADLPAVLDVLTPKPAARLLTFFGMMPNFEPEEVLPRLAGLLRAGDLLLVSANLAPGADYAAGMQRILPLYDNEPTRAWLLAFLADAGVEPGDGELRLRIENGAGELLRVTACFNFRRARELQVDSETVRFEAGDSLRVFFSYRHTASQVRSLLGAHGLAVLGQWVTNSGEEGVFLVSPACS
jgi:uncharacterized SAM-dependent methyltransferase